MHSIVFYGCGYSGSFRRALSSTASENVPNGNWNRDNQQANLNRNDPRNVDENYGAGSAAWIQEFESDFNHPPVIRPISPSLLCAWKILVSLAIFNSKNKRSFNVATSTKLPDFIRYPGLSGLGAFLAIMSSDKQSKIDFSKLSPKLYRHRFSKWLFKSKIILYTS